MLPTFVPQVDRIRRRAGPWITAGVLQAPSSWW